MRKRHIFGFFDEIVRTPAFLLLCAMFLCGAVAGGLTGLIAGEQKNAVSLAGLFSDLPAQALSSVMCALIWVILPLFCALLRPTALFLSALCTARGFVLALTVAVGVAQQEGLLVSVLTTGLPAVLSAPALLAAAAMVWCASEQRVSGRNAALLTNCRAPYLICLGLAAASALLRVFCAALCSL